MYAVGATFDRLALIFVQCTNLQFETR